jgi:hypothetical protein
MLAVTPASALDRAAFAFTRYDLRISVDPHQHSLSAEGTVELRNVSKVAQREAVLQISSSLRWLSILENGEEVEWLQQTYTSDIDHTGTLDEAIVKLGQPVAPGASVRLNLRYSGTVTKDATRLERIGTPEAVARRSDWDEISESFTALRGVGFVVWYPVSMDAANLAQGNELFETLHEWRAREAGASMRVHVSRVALPEGDESKYVFVANGVETKSGADISVEFAGGTDPVIVMLSDPSETTDRPRVAAYYTAGHTNLARDYMAAAEAVIPDMEEWFGTPHSKVVLVELTDPNALPYDSGPFYFVPLRGVLSAAAEVALTRPVVHAMVDSARPWIREGLVAFAQALVREHQAGRREALSYLGQYLPALQIAETQSHEIQTGEKGAGKQLAATPPQALITTSDEVFFRTKAAYVWWMLRDIVGDQAIRAALARYRASDDRDTGYMQRLIESQLPEKRSLETFFDEWVYRDRGLPQLKVDSAYVRKTLGDQTVTAVSIQNLGDVGCEVPVAVRSSGGEGNVRVLVPAKGKAVVRVPFETVPAEAEVNDGSVPESERRDNVIPVSTAPSAQP